MTSRRAGGETVRNNIVLRKITGLSIKVYNTVIKWKWLNGDSWFPTKCRNFLVLLVCNSRELQASFGNLHPDRTFYVIRDPHRKAGLFAVHSFVVGHIKTAIERGLIPVVDMQHYPNYYYTDQETIGRVNWWEHCFKQPSPYTLEEVYRSRNVILCHGLYDGQLSEILEPDKILQNHEIVSNYIQLSMTAKKICEKEWKELTGDKKRILGVKCRGTDYLGLKPVGHSVLPSVKMTIDKIEELSEAWGNEIGKYDAVFAATEDETILQGLKEHFGDRLIYNECGRFGDTGENGLFDVINKGHDAQYKYEKMMDYLVTTYCLSRCDALIAPMVNGTLGALRMKGEYEKVYIFRLGNYQ